MINCSTFLSLLGFTVWAEFVAAAENNVQYKAVVLWLTINNDLPVNTPTSIALLEVMVNDPALPSFTEEIRQKIESNA